MGRLYDMKLAIEDVIARKGVEEYVTKGKISAQAGFVLSLVKRDGPDDPVKIERLRTAVFEVLGEQLY